MDLRRPRVYRRSNVGLVIVACGSSFAIIVLIIVYLPDINNDVWHAYGIFGTDFCMFSALFICHFHRIYRKNSSIVKMVMNCVSHVTSWHRPWGRGMGVHCGFNVWNTLSNEIISAGYNRPISYFHNASGKYPTMHHFVNRNVHTCAHFCYKMVHCVIWDTGIVGFMRWIHWQ